MNTQSDNLLQIKAFDEICDCIFNDDKSPEVHAQNMKTIYASLFQSKESLVDLGKAINAFKISFDNNPNETIKSILENPIFVKSFGEVFTPDSLISDMLSKLPRNVWKNPNLKWLDNSCGSGNFLVFIKNKLMRTLSDVIEDKEEREKHILENMLYGVELQAKNCLIAKYRLDVDEKYNLNVAQHNALTFEYWNTQFDIIVGNPPYQDASGNKGKGHTLWDKFVVISISQLLKPDGYLVYVHPSVWRQPNHPMLDVIKSKQIVYLEIHDANDGQKTFKASTRYDWYVLKNCKCTKKTSIKGQDGIVVSENLNDWNFIPNAMFDEIKNLISHDGDKINLIYSRSAYGADKKDKVSRTKDDSFVHPVVYSTKKGDIPVLFYSNTTQFGHFGIPKVILSNGAGVVIDKTGEYGLTQWAYGIADDAEKLEDIKLYFESSHFDKLKQATQIDSSSFNVKIFQLFKKDFYKDYIS